MPGCIHAVSLEKKKRPFRIPHRDRAWRLIPLWVWARLLCLCLWSTKREVYNHTNSFQVFVTRRSFPAEILWISSGKHIICDLLESAERRLKPKCFTENQDTSLHQTTLPGWQHSNIAVRFVAIPKLYLFVRHRHHLWPITQRAANTCFHTRRGWTSKLRAPGSSFGTSLGPVINFPCSFSQITST